MSIIIKRSDVYYGANVRTGRYGDVIPDPQDVWLTRESATSRYSIAVCEEARDIFLEDYFDDIDTPTDTELSLLELEHGITYLKDE